MDTLFSSVRCQTCGHEMASDMLAVHCAACGDVWLDAQYDLGKLSADWPCLLATRPANLWRYRELLPFPGPFTPISADSGWTPLLRARGLEQRLGLAGTGSEIWIKDERRQPTGSFRDREAALAVNAAILHEVDELVVASTGNRALAYAAACAQAGIKLWVFLPGSVPAAKARVLALYGTEVIRANDTYEQAEEMAIDFAARHGIRFEGARSTLAREGAKTIALEIAEQLGGAGGQEAARWQAPDWYVQSVAGGTGLMGALKGFAELHEAGLIDRVPRAGIVQVQGCAPMVRAWERGLAHTDSVRPNSLISALATGSPGRAYEILKQEIDTRGGAMVAVSDEEALSALRCVARTEGLSVEPAASVAFAGLERLVQEYVQPGERVLVHCSGHTASAATHRLEDRLALQLADRGMAGRIPALHPRMGGPTGILDPTGEHVNSVVIIEDNPDHCRIIPVGGATHRLPRL